MRNAAFGCLVFFLCSLLGPFLALVFWPPSRFDFIYDLIAFLWPLWGFAAYEVVYGRSLAIAVTIALNVVPFVFVGGLAGLTAHRPILFGAVWIAALSMLLAFEIVVGGGGVLQSANIPSVATGLVVASIAFLLVYIYAKRGRASR